MMLKFKKSLALIIFLTLFSAAAIVSCGKQANQEAGDHPADDSTEHPADSTEHPSDSTKNEHPADTTKKQ
jgi:hypothetical protein